MHDSLIHLLCACLLDVCCRCFTARLKGPPSVDPSRALLAERKNRRLTKAFQSIYALAAYKSAYENRKTMAVSAVILRQRAVFDVMNKADRCGTSAYDVTSQPFLLSSLVKSEPNGRSLWSSNSKQKATTTTSTILLHKYWYDSCMKPFSGNIRQRLQVSLRHRLGSPLVHFSISIVNC